MEKKGGVGATSRAQLLKNSSSHDQSPTKRGICEKGRNVGGAKSIPAHPQRSPVQGRGENTWDTKPPNSLLPVESYVRNASDRSMGTGKRGEK